MARGEHLRVEHRVEQGVAMNVGAVAIGELSGLRRQEVFEMHSMERRPGEQCSQAQHDTEVGLVDGAG